MIMDSKVVLITGASSGIGKGIALHLADIGYRRLVLVARRKELLEEVARECRNRGATDTMILMKDLLVPEQCVEVIEETVEKMKALHILIGNAGSGRLGTVRNSSVEDFRFNLDLNLTSNFVLTKHALPHLEKTRGNIVYISSVAGEGIMPKGTGYNVSKAALNHFARMVAYEEASKGIRVNVISPGSIRVEALMAMTGKDSTSEKDIKEFKEFARDWQPLGRIGETLEIAKLVAFVVSDDNSFMTGSVVKADGGITLSGFKALENALLDGIP